MDYCTILLNLLGGAIGGIIGGLFTFFGVKMTINKEDKDKRLEDKKRVLPLLKLSESKYDYRYNYITCDFVTTEESKKRIRKNISDTATITFSINNVGERELYDLTICNIDSVYFKTNSNLYKISPIVYKNDKVNINLVIRELGKYDNDNNNSFHTNDLLISGISFDCYFKDCFDNCYYQKIELFLFHKINYGVPLDKRALEVSIKDFNILTKPIEVEEKDLPWETNN